MTPKSVSKRSTAKARKGRRPMSSQHKKALAQGREQGRTIRRYLDALARQRPKRGRRRTPESINRQLRETIDQLATARSLARVELLQRRIDLEAEIAMLGRDGQGDLAKLEAGFIAAAKSYSERKGITSQAWLQGGVPREVLRQAGLTGGRRGGRKSPAKKRASAASAARRPGAARKATATRGRAPSARRGRPRAQRSKR